MSSTESKPEGGLSKKELNKLARKEKAKNYNASEKVEVFYYLLLCIIII